MSWWRAVAALHGVKLLAECSMRGSNCSLYAAATTDDLGARSECFRDILAGCKLSRVKYLKIAC